MSKRLKGSNPRIDRRLAILFIATGGLFTFIASTLGTLMLANESGISIPINLSSFESHPYLQIFGFLSEFVMGVAYSIIPLFESKNLPSRTGGYVSYALITTANILILGAVLVHGSSYLFILSASLVELSSVLFALEVFNLTKDSARHQLLGNEGEIFMRLSAISFVLLSTVFVFNQTIPYGEIERLISNDLFSPGFLYLSLLGFVGSMIYGVEIKTVAFRNDRYDRRYAKISIALQGLSIAIVFVATMLNLGLVYLVSSITFLFASLFLVGSVRALDVSQSLPPLGSSINSGRNNGILIRNRILSYSKICILSSATWLIVSCLFGVIWLELGSVSYASLFRDSFIHSLAIGFIGSTIIAYAPVLLPGALSGKAPSAKLTLWPLFLLNAGIIVRDAGNLYSTLANSPLPIWEALSGFLILGAMIVFVKSAHSSKVL